MKHMAGRSLSPGLAKGVAVVMSDDVQRTIALPKTGHPDPISSVCVQVECDRMDDALEESKRDLQSLKALACDKPSIASAIELMSAHAAMASDIASLVKKRISSDLVGVEDALDSVICQTFRHMAKIDNDYLREREADIRDIGQRMMRHLKGLTSTSLADLPLNTIIVAREIVPSDAIALANSGVIGIVTELGGPLGHTAIIAQSLGIPAVSGIPNDTQHITSGMSLLIDGEAGTITAEPCEDQLSQFDSR